MELRVRNIFQRAVDLGAILTHRSVAHHGYFSLFRWHFLAGFNEMHSNYKLGIAFVFIVTLICSLFSSVNVLRTGAVA